MTLSNWLKKGYNCEVTQLTDLYDFINYISSQFKQISSDDWYSPCFILHSVTSMLFLRLETVLSINSVHHRLKHVLPNLMHT